MDMLNTMYVLISVTTPCVRCSDAMSYVRHRQAADEHDKHLLKKKLQTKTYKQQEHLHITHTELKKSSKHKHTNSKNTYT